MSGEGVIRVMLSRRVLVAVLKAILPITADTVDMIR